MLINSGMEGLQMISLVMQGTVSQHMVFPMAAASGCGVSDTMISQAAENVRDLRAAVIPVLYRFTARLSVITTVVSALSGGTLRATPLACFAGIASIKISGLFLKRPCFPPERPFVRTVMIAIPRFFRRIIGRGTMNGASSCRR